MKSLMVLKCLEEIEIRWRISRNAIPVCQSLSVFDTKEIPSADAVSVRALKEQILSSVKVKSE